MFWLAADIQIQSLLSLQLGRTCTKRSFTPVPCQGMKGQAGVTEYVIDTHLTSVSLGHQCQTEAWTFHCPISSQITSEHSITYFSLSQHLFFSYLPGSSWAEGDSVVWSLAPGCWPDSLWPGRNFQRISGIQAALRGTGGLPNLTSKLGQERPLICFHQRKGMFVETGSSGAFLTLLLSSSHSQPPAWHWACAVTSPGTGEKGRQVIAAAWSSSGRVNWLRTGHGNSTACAADLGWFNVSEWASIL